MEKITACHLRGILLREKDLTSESYRELAKSVMKICEKRGTLCILHNFAEVALELHCQALHLPLPVLRTLTQQQKDAFSVLGASCHSVEDAIEAEMLGCTYITAGHVFDTQCKKGLPGRGLVFLQEVVNHVSIPVYAIGGIHAGNIGEVRSTGVKGACVMSGMMVCEDPQTYLEQF